MAGNRNKRAYKPNPADCMADSGHEAFGIIYESLITSNAFKRLNPGAKLTYIFCRVNAQTTEGKQCLYNHAAEYGENSTYSNSHFVFPSKQAEKYGLKRENACRYLHQLIDAGFIDLVENNKPRRKVNIYRFSARWKDQK